MKIEVSGKGALKLLQKVCTNNIDVAVGKVVYSVISNMYGGIKSDLTISRLEENKFWVLAGAGNGMIDISWLRANAPDDGSVQIIDWTSAFAGIGLWGPNSRSVLENCVMMMMYLTKVFHFSILKRFLLVTFLVLL